MDALAMLCVIGICISIINDNKHKNGDSDSCCDGEIYYEY